ncbi:MAG TPA: proton-conducting transporter membrane subunit [Phycisphaerae bacterium]
MPADSSILIWVLGIPLVGGVLVLLLPSRAGGQVRAVATLFATAVLLLCGRAAGILDYANPGMQFVRQFRWAGNEASGGSRILMGVDGFSMPLVLMMAGLGVLVCWASYGIKPVAVQGARGSVKGYFSLLLFWIASALGILIFLDSGLFLCALTANVFLLYCLIVVSGAGGDRKGSAARRYLTFGVLALVAMFGVIILKPGYVSREGWLAHGMDLGRLVNGNMPAVGEESASGFFILLGAFGALAAVVPLHGWLADLLAESPTPVGIVAGAGMQTLAGYRLMRLCFTLCPQEAAGHMGQIGFLGLLTAVYGVLAALTQKDLHRAIGFLTITQMGFFLIGISVRTPTAVSGAVFLLVGHGISTAMLLMVAGMIRDRLCHAQIGRLGGIAGHMPTFAALAAVAFLGAMSLPGLCIFPGSLMVLLGAFQNTLAAKGVLLLAVVATLMTVLMAGCCIWIYANSFMGDARREYSNIAQMSVSERSILAILAIISIALGVAPAMLSEAFRQTVAAWLGS